jgi:exodeoxyribonuclease-3
MKIITWNVNGIRAAERKGELHNLLKDEHPEVLFLQEIKGNREQFSPFLSDNDDYQIYYHSAVKKGYAGTGIWLRRDFASGLKNLEFSTEIPKAPNADEGRLSQVSFKLGGHNYELLSIYFPNGGKSDEAWEEKLRFYQHTLEYMNQMHERGRIVIVGGDMNVAHTEIDLARPKDNDGKIGFHPKERAWMDKVIENGWIDAWRYLNPDARDVYSWWTMRAGARDRNVGWRIDYFLLAKKYHKRVKEVSYMTEHRGSDHCPMRLEFE